MSAFDYKALAERVAQRAIYADNNADPNNKAWAADLRAVVSLLNGMADAQPVAWMSAESAGRLLGGGNGSRGTVPVHCNQSHVSTIPLYTHPPVTPQAASGERRVYMPVESGGICPSPTAYYPVELAPAAPQAEPKRDWSAIDAAIREYLDGYELIGENDAGADACYTPTERELYLIYDAINGLLADESFVAAISTPQAEPKREPNPDEVICPACTHQFRAIPENVQAQLWAKREPLSDKMVIACARVAIARIQPDEWVATDADLIDFARAIESEHGIEGSDAE